MSHFSKLYPFRLPILPWITWALGASAFFVEYWVRVSPAVMVPNLMLSFKASSLDISTFAAFFLYAYVLMQIPVGILVDCYGARLCLGLSTLLCAFSTGLFASTDALYIAQLARIGLGLGAAFALVATLKLTLNWFKPQLFSILVGATQALGMVGAAFGAGMMSRLVETFGWEKSTLFFAGVLAVIACLILIFVGNAPPSSSIAATALKHKPKNTNTLSVLENLKLIFRSPQIWLVSVLGGLLFMPTAVFAELWGGFYLVTTQDISTTTAHDGISIVFLGWAIGAPFAGALANHIGRRKVIMISAFMGLILMSCILYIPNQPIWILYPLLFLYGLFNTGLVAIYTTIAELAPASATGVALGFGNGMSVIVGAICQQWVGACIDWLQSERGDNVSELAANDLKWALSIVVIGAVVTLILSFFVKETYKK